jgi:hypothetical protein
MVNRGNPAFVVQFVHSDASPENQGMSRRQAVNPFYLAGHPYYNGFMVL